MDTLPAIELPPRLTDWLDSWGKPLRQKVEAALEFARPRSCSQQACKTPAVITVGTDCSGIEALLHALQGLGIPYRHIFSSECAEAARKVIEANTKPQTLYDTVLSDAKPPFVHLYVSGFSCKPFSLLHHATKLMEEEQAAIFRSVVSRISVARPASFVLENVLGIARVFDEVTSCLESQGYMVHSLLMNPVQLGEPVHRPRYYFIGCRSDVCKHTYADMQQYLSHAWQHLTKSFSKVRAVSVLDRMLPCCHPLVLQHQAFRRDRWLQARTAAFPGGKGIKWQAVHKRFAESMGMVNAGVCTQPSACSPDALYLHLPRERDAWQLLAQKHASSAALVADLSQNVNRASVRTDGCLSTVTPSGVFAVREAQRVVVPMEKILLHGFPIHRMVWPSCLTDHEIASMGGNTMHVHIVGVAIMLCLSVVDWSLPQAQKSAPSRDPRSLQKHKKLARSKVPTSKASKQICRSRQTGKCRGRKGAGCRALVKQVSRKHLKSVLSCAYANRWALPLPRAAIRQCMPKVPKRKSTVPKHADRDPRLRSRWFPFSSNF